MNVLLIEPLLTGHHLSYVVNSVRAFIENGYSVIVATSKHAKFDSILSGLSDEFRMKVRFSFFSYNIEGGGGRGATLVRNEFSHWRLFSNECANIRRSCAIDYVFLPYLDYCLYAIGVLGSPFANVPWGGICMRPSFHYQAYGVLAAPPSLRGLKELLFIRALTSRYLKKIHTIDELLFRYINTNRPRLSSQIAFLADPSESPSVNFDAKRLLQLSFGSARKIILVFGAISERKGIDSLIQAVKTRNDVCVILAGKQTPVVRDQILLTGLLGGESLIVFDRYVTESELGLFYSACDIVWLGYRGHFGMSGVLVTAASYEKPLVATNEGLIGYYVRKHNLGFCCDIQDPISVDRAISKALVALESGWVSNPAAFEGYNWENFRNDICP